MENNHFTRKLLECIAQIAENEKNRAINLRNYDDAIVAALIEGASKQISTF